MKTKTRKKTEKSNSKHKNRERVRIARCLWKIGFEKKKSFGIGMKE